MDDLLFNFIINLIQYIVYIVGGFGFGYGYAQRQQRLEIEEKEKEELYKNALRSYPSKNSGNIR